MKAKIAIFTILFSILLITSCDEVTSPQGNAPHNFNVQKSAEGILRISWNYASNRELEFHLDKKTGEEEWLIDYDVIAEGNYQYFDNESTSSNEVIAYRLRVFFLDDFTFSNYSVVKAYFSENTVPSDFEVSYVDQTNILINWQDNCIGEEGFYIDKKIGNGPWQNKYATLPENSVSIEDNAALFDTLYYRISVFKGSSASNTVSDSVFQTLMAPSDLTLTVLDVDKIRINWVDNSDGEDGFYLDRKVGESDWQINYTSVDSNVTTYVDDIDYQCVTLKYRVRAYKDNFYSAYSEIVQINFNLEIIGSIATPGNALDVYFNDWYAFVADEYYGLAVIDCFNPNQPQSIGNYNLADRTVSSFVAGNFIYVATHTTPTTPGRIHKLDITDIQNPILIGYSDTSGIPKDIFILDDFAYIAEGEAGLSIIYIAGSNLYPVSNYPLSDARKVAVTDHYALVVEGGNGLKVFDIQDHQNPDLIANLSTSGSMIDIHIDGDYAYVADGENGLKIIDISDKYNPHVIKRVATGGFAFGVWAGNQTAYLADRELGFYVIETTNPHSPKIRGIIPMISEPRAVVSVGSYAYLTDNEGLKIIRVKP
jgi:hypothetical protein